MSKPQSPRWVAQNESFAVARGVKGSVQKAQLVLALIRGKKVEQALNDLTFSRKKLAESARKALLSAVANAENNHGLNVDQLVVSHAYAEKGLVLKRFMARARGRSAGILKPHCHITVVVGEKAKVEKPAKAAKAPAKKAESKAAPKAAASKAATKAEVQPETTESKE